jgi:putative membrane protein
MLGGLVVIGDTALYGLKLYPFIDYGGDFYILRMDQVIHFYGFFSAAVVMFQLLQKRVRKEVHIGMLIFIATVSSMGLGALNEVIEFIAWLSIENTGVGDMYNLGFDLVSNLFGALVGSFVEAFRRKSIK